MRGSAPYSSCAQEEEKEEEEAPSKPLLSVLHLWRVTPSAASLHKIIRPSKEQLPIIMRATRTSRRKVVMGIWVVSGGGAITVSVYDPKAVQNLDITFLSGWWAELGLPPLKSMAISGLCGVAAYLVQGISLRIPEPDRKGRVDMAKASLQFNPGPPPPLFEFEPCHFDPSVMGQGKASAEAKKGGRGDSRVVWRGMRMFRQRAVLLACARNGPSMMIVRGWDSSMAWRMTNVVTFHEEDWKTWKEVTDQARPLTAPYFSAGTPPEETQSNSTTSASRTAPAAAAAGGEEGEEEGQDRSKPLDGDIRQLSDTSTAATGTAPAAPESDSPSTVDADQGGLSNGAGAGGASPESAATNAAERKPPVKGQFSLRNNSTNNFGGGAAPATDQAKNDRLCQAMADRVEVRFEGRRGKLALRAPRRREEGNGGGGASGGYRSFWGGVGAAGGGEGPVGLQGADEDGDDDDGGHGEGDSDGGMYGGVGGVGRVRGLGGDELGNQEKGTDGSIPRQFLSHKDMEDRVKTLDMEENRIALASGPRRPLEDPDSGMEEWLHDLPGGRSVRAYARRRGADGKLRTVEEIVEQAVRKWKNLGKVLCRLLRMSDYWYGFASDGALLSNEEKASRRISVLQQIVEMRGVGRTTMKTLVRAIAGIDNQFFKHTTAGWPFSRLVDLTSDVRLVRKPPLSVLYEEGETAPRIIGMELPQSDNNAKRAAFIHRGAPGGSIAPRTSLATSGSSIGPGTGTAGTGFNGRSTFTGAAGRNGGGGKREEQQQQQEQQRRQEREPRWIVGAYVVMSGSVDLYVLERGPAAELPTAASQEDLAAKATRGQPMYRPRPPAEWEAADGEAEADGVPAAALARICRYATERTAGQMPVDAAHPPVLNPTPRAIVARGKSKSAVPCDHESESRTDVDSGDSNGDGPSGGHGGKTGNTRSIMCRRGNFRGTVFFVAEGDGDVVLDTPDETAVVFRGGPGGGTGGGSSTESLLAAAAFGNRRARRTGRIRRRCGEENDGGSSEERPGEDHPAGPALEGAASADEQGPAARTAAPSLTSVTSVTESEQKESRRAADDPTRLKAGGNRSTGLHADDAQETVQEGSPSQIPPPSAAATSMPILFAHREPEDWDSGGDGYEGERCPRLAVLKRGDFFGVDPIRSTLAAAASSGRIGQSPSSSFSKRVLFGYSSEADDQGGASAPSSSLAATAAAAADGSVAKTRNKQACCARPGLIGVTDPLAIAADPPAVPPPTFPSLHMASLVAGPGGMRCLAVGLAVLQKICPPVHRRLERAASERYSGWMTDAKRRNEHDWHESLENESVRSLSKPFYDSYAKGNCSESVVTGTVPTDVDSSIGGGTVSVDGGWAGSVGIGGSRSVVSFDDRGDSRNRREDGSVGQAPAPGAAAAPASIVKSIRSVSTFGSFESKKSIFELSRRYIGLALCSSGRGVVPVRLGRAVTEEAVPLKASPRARKNGRLARPRPSPPSPRAVSGSSTLRLSPPPNLAGVGTAGTSSAENADDGDLDAGTSLGDGCCSRGRRCGASPTRERSAPSERLGGGAEIGILLERYHEIERYDCPVSPFSNPPSWADTPPAATIEPPGVPPPPTNPRDCITVVEGVGGECHPAGGDSPMPLQQAEDETRKASSAERPVEKTVFQLISTRRRTSFGWGWKRPPGGKGRRRRRSELSPRERKLLSGISNLGRVYPPTS
eukprot:g1988.t1